MREREDFDPIGVRRIHRRYGRGVKLGVPGDVARSAEDVVAVFVDRCRDTGGRKNDKGGDGDL